MSIYSHACFSNHSFGYREDKTSKQLADALTATSTAIVVPKLNTWTVITVEPCVQPSARVVVPTTAFATTVVAVPVQLPSPIAPQA